MQVVGADFHNPSVGLEYRRWVEAVGPADPYISKYTIGVHEVLQAHFLLVDFFHDIGEGIGGVGPKSINLLHSALSRQFVSFGGQSKWNDRILICASLMYGLIKNHPFHDANKRTAFLTAILHLQKIGRTPVVSQKEFEDFTVNVSDNNLSTYYGYEKYDGVASDKDVAFMAYFLKKNTRQIDLTTKQITYNDLNTLLSRRGMFLDNPKNNRIDLMLRVELDGTHLPSPKRIAKIGFHGWSREVSRRDIDIVREASKLDARHGYDSQAFFNGLDDPMTLIKKYKEPLERLAFR
jgi:prophage maintenance system killer protein